MTNYTTRRGRVINKPEQFKPTEDTFIDDFREDEYDTDDSSDSSICTDEEIDSDSEYDEDDCEEDDNGNLKGFIVSDSEEDEEDT